MDFNISIELFGLIAGAVTSFGFIPQLIKGYRTKQLDDISTYMPLVLAFGMTLWFIYGLLQGALAVIYANLFGICCCMILIYMKKSYSKFK
jgi:MtN3 and saliva related transmembrane protein